MTVRRDMKEMAVENKPECVNVHIQEYVGLFRIKENSVSGVFRLSIMALVFNGKH